MSMVPPLLLAVEPQHRVLDLCATSHHRTAQVLEMLHAGTMMPSGVVANVADAQQCSLLAQQAKRVCSPALIVTNCQPATCPIVTDCATQDGILFDRILCDVPSSNDGTICKAPDIRRQGTPDSGNKLHPLQLEIALRACQMLKPGGRMVYSTCTINPVEDEAVVAQVLRVTKGVMELQDLSAELPGLKRLPGRKTWYPRDKFELFNSWEQAEEAKAPQLTRSMFPDAQSHTFPMERCMHILPHHHDTGGFFVAVFTKVAKYPDAGGIKRPRQEGKGAADPSAKAASEQADATSQDMANPPAAQGIRLTCLNPVAKVSDAQLLSRICDFYGVQPEFPLRMQTITRSLAKPGHTKDLQVVSKAAMHMLQNDLHEALKVTLAGLRVFERREHKDEEHICRYRIVQEGLPLLLPHVTRQLLQLTVAELLHLVEDRSVWVPEEACIASSKPAQADGEQERLVAETQKQRYTLEDSDTLEQIRNLSQGCCVVMPREAEAAALGLDSSRQTEGALSVCAPLAVTAWMGRASLSVLASKGDCGKFAERLTKARHTAAAG